jgi:hypothetical protein
LYLTICHYVSCRLKEIADASMQAAESLTPPQAATKIMAGMAEWRNGGMADKMAEWQKEWQNGRMAGMATYVLFMVHTDTNDDTDNGDT